MNWLMSFLSKNSVKLSLRIVTMFYSYRSYRILLSHTVVYDAVDILGTHCQMLSSWGEIRQGKEICSSYQCIVHMKHTARESGEQVRI